MSGTPPFSTYLFSGADGLDYTSQLIGETSSGLGPYRQKLDPAIDLQIIPDMSSRSDPSTTGRDDARYSRSADEGNYKMVGEAIKTRDMNRLGLDPEYKGRDNSTPLNMGQKNGEYLPGYVPDAMRNLAHNKQKEQTSLYADMGYYSSQARLPQPQLPITALNPFLSRSRQTAAFPSIFQPYISPLPFSFDAAADIAAYNVDRRTPLSQNYCLPSHMGAGLANLSQNYPDQEPNRSYLGPSYGQIYTPPYSSSPVKLQRKYNESDPWHTSQMNSYNHPSATYAQSTNQVLTNHSDTSKVHSTSSAVKTYAGNANNSAARTGEASIIDLTNSNSPDVQSVTDTESNVKAKGLPPPLVHKSDKGSRENSAYRQQDCSRNPDYSYNKKAHSSVNSYLAPTASSPNSDRHLMVSHLDRNRESSYRGNMYEPRTNDSIRSKLIQNNADHSMLKLGAQWPPSGYHTPPPQYPSSDFIKQSNSFSTGFKSKHLPHPGSDLTFNYPEGASAKSERLQQAMKYGVGSGNENGLFSKSRPWPKKGDSKLSDLEHQIMDSAREGKLPSNLMQPKSGPLSNHPRPVPLHHVLPSHLTTPRAPPEYSVPDLSKIEKLPEHMTMSPSEQGRNTVIQSVPRLPTSGEIENVPSGTQQKGHKYDTVNARDIAPLFNEDQNAVHFGETRSKEMINGISETSQALHKAEKTSLSKPGRKRKLSKIKDLEQRPKRKYTKRSEIWKKREAALKMKNMKKQATCPEDAESDGRKDDLPPSEVEPRQSDDVEQAGTAVPEPVPIKKNMRRQRKSGDMEEYLYGWITDEEVENDDSSDEDYSCPTQVSRYKVRASTKPRATRRTTSMKSDDTSYTEDQYSSHNEEKCDRRKKDLRRKRRWKKERKVRMKTGRKIGRPKSVKKSESKTDESLNDYDDVEADLAQSENSCEKQDTCNLPETNCAKNENDSKNNEESVEAKNAEIYSETENRSDAKNIEICVETNNTANTDETKSTKVYEDGNLCDNSVESKLMDNIFPNIELLNKTPASHAEQNKGNSKIEGNDESQVPMVRKKRKYTRRLGEDGLPIKRAKRTKQKTDDKPNDGLPRIKRKYRKLSAKWNKGASVSEKNGIITEQNSVKIPSEISPALIELYTSNQVEDSEKRKNDEELSSLHENLQKPGGDVSSNKICGPTISATSSDNHDNSATSALPNTVPSVVNEKTDDSCNNQNRIQPESVQNDQSTAKAADAATQSNAEVPVKIRKKPGRKPGWRKYPQNETAMSNSQPNSINKMYYGVKKKYKKPKGDGLPRFGMRKKGRRPKHNILKSNAFIPSSQEPSQRQNKISHLQHRKYTLSKTGKKLGRPCTKTKNIATNNLIHKIKLEQNPPVSREKQTKFDVHKISEELQSQEYDYDFSSELALYNNGDIINEDEGPCSTQESEMMSCPSSPPPCQSRPQTPIGLLTPLQQSPFPSHLKKLCCNSAIGETPLHKAARNGLIENLQYYLETGTRANQSDNAGYTALHEACVHNHKDVATMLLQYGSDVNKNAEDGTRPLHDAVEYDHLEMARLMLAAGADHMLSKYSGRAIPNMIRSKKMGRFIHAYFKELQEKMEEETVHDRELDWIIPCSAVFDKGASHCYSVLDDPPNADANEHFVSFELFDEFPVNTYLLQPDEETERSNYCLLDDYLKMTQGRGKRQNSGSIQIVTISTENFKSQIKESQIQNAVLIKNSTLDLSGNFIELLAVGSDFADASGADTVQIGIYNESYAEKNATVSVKVKREHSDPIFASNNIETDISASNSNEPKYCNNKLDDTNTSATTLSDRCYNISENKAEAAQCSSRDTGNSKQDLCTEYGIEKKDMKLVTEEADKTCPSQEGSSNTEEVAHNTDRNTMPESINSNESLD